MTSNAILEAAKQTIPLVDYVTRTQQDLTKNRREDKYCIERDLIVNLTELLNELGFQLVIHKAEPFFYYHNTYFDTPDDRLYRWHRQGRYHRVKVRIREYLNRDKGIYLECKIKSKGRYSRKERLRLDEHAEWRQPYARHFLETQLKGFDVHPHELIPTIQTGYRRLTWVSDQWPVRITLDDRISIQNVDELARFIESHGVLEIKSTGPIHDLERQLKGLKLTKQPFSKYCIGSHLLKPKLKANPWRQTLNVLQVT